MMGHLLEHEAPFKLLCLSDVARGLYEGCELVVGDGVLVDAVPPGTPANLAATTATVETGEKTGSSRRAHGTFQ